MLNPASPVPLYRQLADDLLASIRDGRLHVGSRIPGEHELAERHGIGRPTVRQATEVLVRRGVLQRRRGAGTFVARPPQDVDLFSLGGTLSAFEGGGAAARPGGASVSGGEAAAARYGTLSVYYLGGVGSVELDGAALPDPPLTGYRVRAGRHVLRCRLPRDAEPHTLEVIVEPGRETVVEYELGGRPRATIGETP